MQIASDSVLETITRRRGLQRVPHPKIELFQLKDFVGRDLREKLIELIERDHRPSTIADANLVPQDSCNSS